MKTRWVLSKGDGDDREYAEIIASDSGVVARKGKSLGKRMKSEVYPKSVCRGGSPLKEGTKQVNALLLDHDYEVVSHDSETPIDQQGLSGLSYSHTDGESRDEDMAKIAKRLDQIDGLSAVFHEGLLTIISEGEQLIFSSAARTMNAGIARTPSLQVALIYISTQLGFPLFHDDGQTLSTSQAIRSQNLDKKEPYASQLEGFGLFVCINRMIKNASASIQMI